MDKIKNILAARGEDGRLYVSIEDLQNFLGAEFIDLADNEAEFKMADLFIYTLSEVKEWYEDTTKNT